MQHIDEALLHEYLDRGGETDPALREIEAHLETCDSCRARLDEAGALRAAASDILRAASPATRTMPSFESIAARSGASAVASKPVRTSNMGRMAWAATIVLALGAGWMARSMYRWPVEPTVSDSAPAASSRAEENAAVQLRPQASDLASGTAASSDAAVPSGSREAVTGATAPPAVARREAAGNDLASGGQGATTGQAGMVAAAPPPAPVSAPPAERASLAAREQVSAKSIAAGSVAAEPDARVADDVTLRLVGPTSWLAVTADSAYALHGGSLVQAAGMVLIDYARNGLGSATLVRVRHRTRDGDTIEVVQTMPPGFASGNRILNDLAAAPAAPAIAAPPPQASLAQSIRKPQPPLASGTIEPTSPSSRRRYYVRVRSDDGRDVAIITTAQDVASDVVLEVMRRRR